MTTVATGTQRKSDADRVNRMIQALDEYRVSPDVYEVVDGVQIGLRPSRAGNAIYIMKIRPNWEYAIKAPRRRQCRRCVQKRMRTGWSCFLRSSHSAT